MDALEPMTVLPWQVRLWKRHFNSDPGVIGKKLILDQQPIMVIGVLPENFSFFGDDVDFIALLGVARFDRTQLVLVRFVRDLISTNSTINITAESVPSGLR